MYLTITSAVSFSPRISSSDFRSRSKSCLRVRSTTSRLADPVLGDTVAERRGGGERDEGRKDPSWWCLLAGKAATVKRG